MRIESVDLRFFRSHEHLALSGLAQETWIVGPNGSGKTNLLEAIAYLGGVRLRPVARDRDLVRFGAPGFRIRSVVRSGDGRDAEIEARVQGRSRRIFREGKPVRPGGPGLPAVVTFTPDDLEIVKGAPEERRRVLEQDIGAHSVRMRDLGSRYLRTVRQRNALLAQIRDGLAAPGSLAPWDAALCDLGGRLQAMRALALRDLGPALESNHRRVTEAREADPVTVPVPQGPGGTPRFEVRYRPSGSGRRGDDPEADGADADVAERPAIVPEVRLGEEALATIRSGALKVSLENVRPAEIARGHTLVGPHRDDLEFLLDGRDMRLYASQGQQRTAVIALKAAIVDRVTEARRDPPVLLLDDVLSELDPSRQQRLRDLWRDVQTFVTTAEPLPQAVERGEGRGDDVTIVRLGDLGPN